MDEPIIKKFPTEVFGRVYTDRSQATLDAFSNQYCRFLDAECNKPRKSEPRVKIGTCSVGYKGDFQGTFQPVIICPNRFRENHVLETVKELYLRNWGDDIKWVQEGSIGVGGSIDLVATRITEDREAIIDFLCIEFQAAGTTGTPFSAVLELKQNGEYSARSYPFGINWANEFIKTMMQQVYKKGKIIQLWGKKIVFVVQDVALDYLHHSVDTSEVREAKDSDPIHFLTFKMVWSENAWILQFVKAFSTNVDGVSRMLGGAGEQEYVTVDGFKTSIYVKAKRDGVL